MDSERIKEIQSETAYPESVSVQQALLKVWNECAQVGKTIVFPTMEKVRSEALSRHGWAMPDDNDADTENSELFEEACLWTINRIKELNPSGTIEENNGWISAEDRLPESDGQYLVSDGSYIELAIIDLSRKTWSFDSCGCDGGWSTDDMSIPCYRARFWRPLPTPPKR